jgi:hypothetical protein
LLWLAFAVLVRCLRRFRRLFPRAFLRSLFPVAAWRLAALPVLMLLFAGRVLRRLCFRLRRLVRVAVLLRLVRLRLFAPLPLPVRAAVWWLSFLRRVRLVCFLRLALRVALRVSVRVRGLRLRWLSVWAFRSSFFRAFRLVCRRFPFFLLRGLALGFRLVLAFGLPVFVLFSLPLLCYFNLLFSYIYIAFY